MIEVNEAAFFAAVGGPENVHPRNNRPDQTAWEIVSTREIVGKSTPGYIPTPGKPRRYFLARDFAAKKGIAQQADEQEAQR